MQKHKPTRILFSGGGTLGSVTPLLAMFDIYKKARPDIQGLWVGTMDGPERALVEEAGLPFFCISAGKFRRYASMQNMTDMIRLGWGILQALLFLQRQKPSLCITAGGYVSVPVHVAAWLLGIPTWVHQQDVQVGLANKMMARKATMITTALKEGIKQFSARKPRWIGNPVRVQLLHGDASRAIRDFSLDETLPLVLATGGGTGAALINDTLVDALPLLDGACQIIHVYGEERPRIRMTEAAGHFTWYHPVSFLGKELRDVYAVAELVVSRAGFGTLSELAALKKPALLIPKEGHQDDNAHLFEKAGAVAVLEENGITAKELAETIQLLLKDAEKRHMLGEQLHAILHIPSERRLLHILDTCISVL